MDLIIDLQESYPRKIQLTVAINFISSKDAEEESVMYAKSDNKEFVTYDNANGIVDELQKKPLSRYQDNLETSIRDRERERKRDTQREREEFHF